MSEPRIAEAFWVETSAAQLFLRESLESLWTRARPVPPLAWVTSWASSSANSFRSLGSLR